MTEPVRSAGRPTARSALGAAALLTLLTLSVVSLHLLGRGALAMPPVDSLAAVREWAASRDPITIAMAAARLLALGVAYHLVATTVLAAVGKLVRRPGLVRAAEAATIPALRGTVRRSAGLALSLAALLAGPFAPAAGSGRSGATLAAVERPEPGPLGDRSSASAPVVLERIETGTGGSGQATLRALPGAPAGRATLRHLGAAPSPSAPGPTQHRVVAGDHLWSIAESAVAAQLGRAPTDAEVAPYWRTVVAANPQLADPDLLYPGESITVPPLPGGPDTPPAGTATLHADPAA